jgi:hypothetical protein
MVDWKRVTLFLFIVYALASGGKSSDLVLLIKDATTHVDCAFLGTKAQTCLAGNNLRVRTWVRCKEKIQNK